MTHLRPRHPGCRSFTARSALGIFTWLLNEKAVAFCNDGTDSSKPKWEASATALSEFCSLHHLFLVYSGTPPPPPPL